MKTLNFNATFQTTPELTLSYANFLGYQEIINDIPNPQSAEDFVCEHIKSVVAREIAKLDYERIEQENIVKMNLEKSNALETVKGSLEVNIQ